MIYIIVSTFVPSMMVRVTCYSSKQEYLKHFHLAIKHRSLDEDYNYSFFKFSLRGVTQYEIAKSITRGCLGDSIGDLADLINTLDIITKQQ